MPRKARTKSISQIYHIVIKGIDARLLFEGDPDKDRFMSTLARFKKECHFELFAYCLMDNHVHILARFADVGMADVMRKICVSYAYYYNQKNSRRGYLFQDRFHSECVEKESYLLTAMRYIHQNPIKAGMCTHANEYAWSSYNAYLTGGKYAFLVDRYLIDGMLTTESFIKFNDEQTDEVCLEAGESGGRRRLTDSEAVRVAELVTGCKTIGEFSQLNKEERDNTIRQLRKEGLGIRQISRITGWSAHVVEKNTWGRS